MKKKFQNVARFAVKHGETILTVIAFAAGFIKAVAESERKPRR